MCILFSVIVGDQSSKFGEQMTSGDEFDYSENEETADLELSDHDVKNNQPKPVKKKNIKHTEETAIDEDTIEDLVRCSDEEDNLLSDSLEEDNGEIQDTREMSSKKRKQGTNIQERKGNKKSKKRKKTHGK